MEEGAIAGAEAVAEEGGVHVFDDERPGTCSRTSRTTPRPPSSCWSTTGPCRCATRSHAPAGFRISDGFISPLDLVEIGLHTAEEAQELHELETTGAA